jgi:hypothetical protein
VYGPVLILWIGDLPHAPGATLIRLWSNGMTVISGPDKIAVLDTISRLRVSGEAEAEDGNGAYRSDPLLRGRGYPMWLFD